LEPTQRESRHFQGDAPCSAIQIRKTEETWNMKIETESEWRNKDLGRAKALTITQKRALVVEDEPALCALIQEVLVSAGIEAVTLAKSTEADGHFQEEKFDVVLIGLCTPSPGGIDLVRKIRRAGFNQMTPIIMISDDQRPGALSRGFEAGASFFVYKPIDKLHLMKLVRVTQGTIEHEKRRFRRVPVHVKVRLKSTKAELEGETNDISLNGALVRAPHTLPPGSLVEVSLYLLAGTVPVVGLGSVTRVLGNSQMGIRLDRFPVPEIGRLQEYLLPLVSD
jgi:DNA-binding response OmpR family regulator